MDSKSTDLPASLILSRPCVFDGIMMFYGTNGRKLFMDFAVFLPYHLPLSTEFQDLLLNCSTCYCIFSPLYHTAFNKADKKARELADAQRTIEEYLRQEQSRGEQKRKRNDLE